VPPGRLHGFHNNSDRPARHLAIASPAETMTMIEELTKATPEHRAAIFARYRTHLAE
jgi:quercetin dioxygenase-like cupin family protein